MKKHTVQHPYVLASLVAMVGLVIGIGIRFVTAASFTDPGCDPTASGGPTACNASGPLLLNPTDAATTTQTVLSAVQFGKLVTLADNIQLAKGKQILTANDNTGIGANFLSSNDYAVLGSSAAGAKAGIYGKNTAASLAAGEDGPGVYATSEKGYALKAYGLPNGKAGRFDGQVDIIGATNITGTLKVNGADVNPGAGTAGVVTDNATASQTKTVNLATALFSGQKYQINSIAVQYANNTVQGVRTWITMPAANYSYAECVANNFSGDLSLTNPITSAVDYRIVVNFSPTTVSCGDSTAPQVTAVGGMTLNNFYKGPVTVTATANDPAPNPSGVQKVLFAVDNAAPFATDTTPGDGWSTVPPLDTTTLSPTHTNFTPNYATCTSGGTPHTLKVTAVDFSGNTSAVSSMTFCTANYSYITPCGLYACWNAGGTPNCCSGTCKATICNTQGTDMIN